jgi:hypothetical protein
MDHFGFRLGSDSCYHGVASEEEEGEGEDVSCNEAASAWRGLLIRPKGGTILDFAAAKDSIISVNFPEKNDRKDICEISGIRVDTISHHGP